MASRKPILRNLTFLCEHGASLTPRCPIVPGYNDREDHFRSIAQWATRFSAIGKVELMAYHPFGNGKITRGDQTQKFIASVPTVEQKQKWLELIVSFGFSNVSIG